MFILLPLILRLSPRTRLAVGLVLITFGLVAIIAAIAHGVIALIIGGTFLLAACRRRRERLTYRPVR